MIDLHGEDVSDITDFVASDLKHLYGGSKTENKLGFQITPDPRSWAAVTRVEKVLKTRDYGDDARLAVLSGLIGSVFVKYKDHKTPVKPLELVGKTVSQISDTISKNRLTRTQIMALIFGYVGFARKKPKDKNFIQTSLNFIKSLATNNSNKELAVLLTQYLIEGSISPNLKATIMTNKNAAKTLSHFLTLSKTPDTLLEMMLADGDIQKILAEVCWGKNIL
jgi:hypothetical protein